MKFEALNHKCYVIQLNWNNCSDIRAFLTLKNESDGRVSKIADITIFSLNLMYELLSSSTVLVLEI